jgi:tryptophan synthase alpha chain
LGRIGEAFAAARGEGRAALMPYMMGGYPDAATSAAIADVYGDAGADLVELGVPFSDPLADGPVIHAAGTQALAGGATLESVLKIGARIADRVPVAAMVYANMILAAGPTEFAARLSAAGFSGTIVPDLPLEEAPPIREALNGEGLELVPLVAPTTPAARRRRICGAAQGFVYVVSDVGVTGERGSVPPRLRELVEAVREAASVPAAVGFGISTPQQAAEVGEVADGVIIGTRLVRAVAEANDVDDAVAAVADFLRATREQMGAGAVIE